MANERLNRQNATVTTEARMIADGEIADLSDWSDAELIAGRRRDKNGGWKGRSPKLIPAAFVRELQRRRFTRAHALLAYSLVDAVKLLRAIVNDEEAPRGLRIKAAREIMNRVLGLPTERISLDVFGRAAWERVVAEAIVPTADDGSQERALPSGPVIDAEVVEDNEEIDLEAYEPLPLEPE